MSRTVSGLARFLCLCSLAAGLAGCAAAPKPADSTAADLYSLQQQFAGGKYLESMAGCKKIIASRPGCAALDQALYYAALNSMRLDPCHGGGKVEAAQYLRSLIQACPASPYRPEAEIWLAVLTALMEKVEAACPPPAASHSAAEKQAQDCLKKKDQEIKRLRGDIQHLNREIDLLKNVDVQLYEQKKDLDNGPDEGKNPRP